MAARDTQVGGNHYQQVIQPFELAYVIADGDSAFCKVAKYLVREKDDYEEQLRKASHILALRRELEVPDKKLEWNLQKELLLRVFTKQCKFPEESFNILKHAAHCSSVGAQLAKRDMDNLIDEIYKPK